MFSTNLWWKVMKSLKAFQSFPIHFMSISRTIILCLNSKYYCSHFKLIWEIHSTVLSFRDHSINSVYANIINEMMFLRSLYSNFHSILSLLRFKAFILLFPTFICYTSTELHPLVHNNYSLFTETIHIYLCQ